MSRPEARIRDGGWHNRRVSEVADLERAVDDASAAVAADSANDAGAVARVARAGAAALAIYRRFEASPLVRGPRDGTAADRTRVARHDIRASAQGVLAQLELITLAWMSWNATTRDAMLGELEAAGVELERTVGDLLGG